VPRKLKGALAERGASQFGSVVNGAFTREDAPMVRRSAPLAAASPYDSCMKRPDLADLARHVQGILQRPEPDQRLAGQPICRKSDASGTSHGMN